MGPPGRGMNQLARGRGRQQGVRASRARCSPGRPHVAAPPAATKGDAASPPPRDVRAMPIKLITVGKANSHGAELMAAEWLDKLRRYTQATEVSLKPNPRRSTDAEVQRTAEGEKVLKAVAPGDWLVVLDERGREVTSEQLAALIARAGDEGRPLAFAIGGPFGHGAAVRGRADDMLRLSRLVLNHQVAHVLLLEQLYRAWTILTGSPYHH